MLRLQRSCRRRRFVESIKREAFVLLSLESVQNVILKHALAAAHKNNSSRNKNNSWDLFRWCTTGLWNQLQSSCLQSRLSFASRLVSRVSSPERFAFRFRIEITDLRFSFEISKILHQIQNLQEYPYVSKVSKISKVSWREVIFGVLFLARSIFGGPNPLSN